jgi:hypothetical protein
LTLCYSLFIMIAPSELSAALHALPVAARAQLAVELIDSMGEEAWADEDLVTLVEERDAELEGGTVSALSYEQFLSGLKRPGSGA